MTSLVRALAVISTAVAVALAPSAASAQTAPNLSGQWTLDVAASDFGQRPAPQSQTLTVEHTEPSLKLATTSTTERGERTTSASYTTDGTESRNPGAMGTESVSTAKWDAGALALTSKMSVQGNEITIRERWTVSDAGKTLTLARTADTPMGAIAMTMVYRRKG